MIHQRSHDIKMAAVSWFGFVTAFSIIGGYFIYIFFMILYDFEQKFSSFITAYVNKNLILE